MRIADIAVPSRPNWRIRKELEKWVLVCTDFFSMLAALYGTRAAMSFTARDTQQYYGLPYLSDGSAVVSHASVYILLTGLLMGIFWLKGHYWKRQPFWSETRDVLRLIFVFSLLHAASMLLGKIPYSRAALLINWTLAPAVLIAARSAIKQLLTQLGGWIRPMVIIGWGENSIETARAFDDEPMMGYRLLAFLIPDDRTVPEEKFIDRHGSKIDFLTLGSDPLSMLARLDNPHVVLALEQGGLGAYQGTVQKLGRSYRDLQIVPSLRGLPLYGMEVSHFFSHEVLLLSVRNNLARRAPQLVKRCFDIVASACLLAFGFPVFLGIGLCVARSRGPIFYGHRRIGQDGRSFKCYKFRTMLPHAAELLKELLDKDPEAKAEWDRDFKLKDDPRITKIGHFLRKTSLDELPQLWNVLKGEMSLVGPRPIVDAELERYGDQVDYYLQAKPGITGLWQISGRNDITYDSRVYLDSWYVKNWSFFNDIVILLRTVKVILKRDGAY